MRQMGHSYVSLYRYTSIRCPLMYGSWGNCISAGMMTSFGCFDEVVKEAKVLARPLKMPLLEFG